MRIQTGATSRLVWGGLLSLLLILAGCGHGAYRSDLPPVHVVAKGETLYSIAQRFGVSVDYLIFRNRMQPPHTIYVGQKLALQRQIQPGEEVWLGRKPAGGGAPVAAAAHVAPHVATNGVASATTAVAAPTRETGMTPAAQMVWPVGGGAQSSVASTARGAKNTMDSTLPRRRGPRCWRSPTAR